jgi:hypothetical protein
MSLLDPQQRWPERFRGNRRRRVRCRLADRHHAKAVAVVGRVGEAAAKGAAAPPACSTPGGRHPFLTWTGSTQNCRDLLAIRNAKRHLAAQEDGPGPRDDPTPAWTSHSRQSGVARSGNPRSPSSAEVAFDEPSWCAGSSAIRRAMPLIR